MPLLICAEVQSHDQPSSRRIFNDVFADIFLFSMTRIPLESSVDLSLVGEKGINALFNTFSVRKVFVFLFHTFWCTS